MTENDASNDLMPSPAGTVALGEVVAVEFPHAATTIASAPAHAKMVSDLSSRNCASPPDGLVLLGTIFWGLEHGIRKSGTRFRANF
jgi:hypothetical protein